MATMNRRAGNPNATINAEGAVVYRLGALETLLSKSLGSFFGESGFYQERTPEDSYAELVELIRSVPDDQIEYVLKIAYLGRKWNMISYPLAILTASFNDPRFKGGAVPFANYVPGIVRRAKDINEILAIHFATYGNGSTLPSQMRKTLRSRLEKFNRYQLSTGLDRRSDVKLADAIKVLHPKPENEEMAQFYRDIIENKIVLGDGVKQVRTVLSDLGKAEDKEEVIKDLEKTLKTASLLTLLRSLVSYHKNGVFTDENTEILVARLTDPEEIARSKVLPFRYYSAYREFPRCHSDNTYKISDALLTAMDLAIENVPTVDGTTCVLVDVSGSMTWGMVSSLSAVSFSDVALLLGGITYKKGMGDFFTFASEPRHVDISNRVPLFDMLKFAKQMGNFGGGTDLQKALDYIENKGVPYDNLVILTDSDCYGYYFGKTADKHLNGMIDKGIFGRVWINNLAGNDYSVANTNHPKKKIITGFNANFLNTLKIYQKLDSGSVIRVIDELLQE